MTVRLKKSLLLISTIFIMACSILVIYSVTAYENDYPEYSTYSADKTGIKALYLLTGKCGFHVSRYHYPLKFMRDNPVMVAYRPDNSVFNESEEQDALRNWLKNGNTFVMIVDQRNIGYMWIFDFISETRQWYETENVGNVTVTWYGLENGLVCVLDSADRFLNKNISDTADAAVAFINVLARINNPRVVFNEYYRYMQKPAPDLWDLIGRTGQLVVIQLVLVMILVVARGWKPFGRVRGDRKMAIRPENEAVRALAGLYQKRKAYTLVLSNYYRDFTRKYGRYLGTAGHLREKALPVLAECEYFLRTGDLNKKKLKETVLALEELEFIIGGKTRRKE